MPAKQADLRAVQVDMIRDYVGTAALHMIQLYTTTAVACGTAL